MAEYYGKTKHRRVWHRVAYGIGLLTANCGPLIDTSTITTKLPPGARKCRRCWRAK